MRIEFMKTSIQHTYKVLNDLNYILDCNSNTVTISDKIINIENFYLILQIMIPILISVQALSK